MDEPFDEIMGPPPGARNNKPLQSEPPRAAVVSPDPSPTARSSTGPPSSAFATGPPSSAFAGHSSSGPPPSAFSGHSTSPRWAVHERDDATLRRESDIATGNAVHSAAVRAADRMGDGSSLPHPEEVRTSSQVGGGFSFNSNRKSRRASTEQEEIVYETHDQVRAEAMKVLEMADDVSSPFGVRKTSTGGFTTDPTPKKRVPSKLAGFDFATTRAATSPRRANSSSAKDRRWTIDDDEDDDMVDVVEMENTIGRSSTTSASTEPESAWSSRYNVNQSLLNLTTGFSSTKDYLDNMDQNEKDRMDKSARNMFRTSPHQKKAQSPKIFGNGFSFKAKNVFGKRETGPDPKNVNLKTVWMDVDLQSNGRSLPPPPVARRGPKSIEQARKRRRICLGTIIAVVFIGILVAVLGAKADKMGRTSSSSIDPNAVKFYVTADVPYDAGQESKIIRDLETIPGDADFLVHLGNIQDAAVTLCPQQSYISAKAILRKSPSPVFVLPGPNDWNNCPFPKIAFEDWKLFLGKFERNFVHNFGVAHQLGNEENFSFLQKGVLIIGLHLVSGRKHDKEAWKVRHAMNVRWVQNQLSTVPRDNYRALIFLANARPSQQQDDFFDEILNDINNLNKPVLYIHANTENGKFETYKPFKNAPSITAVQVPSGGSNEPILVGVNEGSNPFVLTQ